MIASTEVLGLTIERCPEPLAAYTALTDGGRRAGTALLESAVAGRDGHRRSLLALAPALDVSLVGRFVTVRALSANGRAAVARLGGEGELVLPVPEVSTGPRDERARLLEASVLDPMRTLLATLMPARAADRGRLLLVGAVSFELAVRFEGAEPTGEGGAPDYRFTVPELVLDIDHERGRSELYAVAFDAPARHDLARTLDTVAGQLRAVAELDDEVAPSAEPAVVNCDDAAFGARVERARDAVRAGEVYQVVLSRHWTLPCADPLAAYRRLRRDNPAPYLFYLRGADMTLFGASPEASVRFDAATRTLEMYPVAGTRPRGRDADEDARIEAELRLDAKELAEHMMLVDLARNDIARVCEPGSRSVPELLGVARYAHVMHLVSRVRGRLQGGLDALHALRACLNMGTLSGAPKIRASELIREIEGEPRGFYGGAVGVLDAAGNLDTAITIRAACVRDGQARVQAGAGIVLASDPQAEADETTRKARAVLEAIA